MSQQRFRRLTDLFVDGLAVPVGDGTFLWLQALNAFERDEAVSDAQVARARLVMALKGKGDERAKIETRLIAVGRDQFVTDLASAKADSRYSVILARLEDDPEWSEKVNILRRSDFVNNSSAMLEEQELLNTLLAEWSEEVDRRLKDEVDYQRRTLENLDDESLLEEYVDAYMERRGDEVANAEFGLTETWYSTRFCNALPGDGSEAELDHASCDGHKERVFETKADVKAAPDRLRVLIREGLNKLAMSLRDPKGSGSPQSSSASPPAPSVPAA